MVSIAEFLPVGLVQHGGRDDVDVGHCWHAVLMMTELPVLSLQEQMQSLQLGTLPQRVLLQEHRQGQSLQQQVLRLEQCHSMPQFRFSPCQYLPPLLLASLLYEE